MPKHPTNNLTVREGKLFTVDGPVSPYLDCRPVKVVKKKEFIRKPGTDTFVYRFEIDNCTDPIWREFFKGNCANPTVEFAGNQMSFQSEAKELEATYQAVKAAIAKANSDYITERNDVIKQVEQIDHQRKAARKVAKAEADALKQQFYSLQL